MSNLQKQKQHILKTDAVANKISELMGNKQKSKAFLTSALSVIQSNDLLKKADELSVYQSVMTAVTLDLPINPNLGFAYIVPYKGKAQFQIGYKGLIQLCWRSGNFKTISSTEIFEGQLVEENPLTGFKFDWKSKTSEKVIGYAAYFELLNGASKTFYMPKENVEKHAKKYSQSYKKGFGVWSDDFDSMAKKTVLKLLLSRYAPMTIEMQTAAMADQAVVEDFENQKYNYDDNASAVIIEDKPLLDDEAFEQALEVVKNGDTTLSDIQDIYQLSEYQIKELKTVKS